MGGRQSKRSVDISGKEAEGEVVAVEGQGKLEPIADLDTLKPQPNGDTAHTEATTPAQITETEKPLENGTPEIEKESEAEKKPEQDALANGTKGEEKVTEEKPAEESEETKPAPEVENKKIKKDKVKKKWSFRSISFSRKDKPKHEKKNKDEDNKANGESEKLAEEVGEPEAVAETKPGESDEASNEKTPETPITEPITNGSSKPETPEEKTPVIGEKTVEISEKSDVAEIPAEEPVKSVSVIDEPVVEDAPKVENGTVESKSDVPVVEPPVLEDVAAKVEVCVSQEESNPPPLPDNPPPSSVTVFAETTMAQHLVESSIIENQSAPITLLAENTELIAETKTNKFESPIECTVATVFTNSEINFEKLSQEITQKCTKETIENVEITNQLPKTSNILDEKSVEEIKDFVSETLETGKNVVDDIISKNVEEVLETAHSLPKSDVITEGINYEPEEKLSNTNGVQTEVVEQIEKENTKDTKTLSGNENGVLHANDIEAESNVEIEQNGMENEEERKILKKKIIESEKEQVIEDLPSPIPDESTDVHSESETHVLKNGNDDHQEESSSASELSLPPPPENIDAVQDNVISVADKLAELSLPEAIPEIKEDIKVSINKELMTAGEN